MINFKLLIEKALKLGFSDIEIVEKSSKSLEISIFRSAVEQNVLSEDNSISIRAMYNDKMANISIENFDCDLDEILNKLMMYNAVIPALKVVDTIKEVKDNVVVKTINREILRSVQTPQGFKTSLIYKVHQEAITSDFTDDSSMIEQLSDEKVYVVNGEKNNYKYTEKEDF